MNMGLCPLVVGVHGVFCAGRLPVSPSVFLTNVYTGYIYILYELLYTYTYTYYIDTYKNIEIINISRSLKTKGK